MKAVFSGKNFSFFRFYEIFAIYDQVHNVKIFRVCNTGNHYENLPMQYTEIFSPVKIENFVRKFLIFFLFLLKT